MSISKKIRTKIKSVQSTQKITRAMQMVATSKMRKTQQKMRLARPYAEHIRRMIVNLTSLNNYSRSMSNYLRIPTAFKNVAIILITTDKGLCGGLNTNAIKLFYNKVKSLQGNKFDINIQICALGYKGLLAANKIKLNVTSSTVALGDTPKMEQLIGPLSAILNGYKDGAIDEVYVIYSKFINTMKQVPLCEKLLPITTMLKDESSSVTNNINKNVNNDEAHTATKATIDYLCEPSLTEVLDGLMRRYIESIVYQCLTDNMASEQVSRMMAMRTATDNANDAIASLKLAYNKSRQALITKELAEIVSGSSTI